jgi:NADPH:quinone reductase-like Zn-dependent oxidoreductase
MNETQNPPFLDSQIEERLHTKTMSAVVLHALGGVDNFRFDRVAIPHPAKGEIRIRIKAAAFNPVDFKIRQGEYGDCTPSILGADCSGIIDQIGEAVNNFAVGDEVYAMSFGQSSNGSYAQYVCVPYHFVARKPKHLSFEEAACIPLASLTAYRATLILQSLRKDGAIFIAGAAGGVGTFAVQFARYFHSDFIYTISGSDETSVFLTEKLGIKKEHIISYQGLTTKELTEKLIALNQDNFFIATFDFVGQEMKTLCLELADYSGHVISTVPEEPKTDLSPWSKGSPYFQRNLSIHPIFVGAESYFAKPEAWEIYHEHLMQITHLLNTKKITVPFFRLMGGLSIDTVKNAHRLLETGRVKGKLVMSID